MVTCAQINAGIYLPYLAILLVMDISRMAIFVFITSGLIQGLRLKQVIFFALSIAITMIAMIYTSFILCKCTIDDFHSTIINKKTKMSKITKIFYVCQCLTPLLQSNTKKIVFFFKLTQVSANIEALKHTPIQDDTTWHIANLTIAILVFDILLMVPILSLICSKLCKKSKSVAVSEAEKEISLI